MSPIDDNERRVVEPGEFEAAVGGGPWPDRQPVLAVRPGDRQPGYATNVLTGRFAVIGTVAAVE
jgi:hypothetical protein